MLGIILAFLLTFHLSVFTAQQDVTIEWTWISGNKQGEVGIYGQKGVPSTANMPGARQSAVGWYDESSKEFWLFGGQGYGNTKTIGLLNDLWKFNVEDLTWTWVSGSDSVNHQGVYNNQESEFNVPGARLGAVGWYDSSSQEFWLFGGRSIYSSGWHNDLWRYRVKDSTWTLISGSQIVNAPGSYGTKGQANISNFPGAREHAVGWYDSFTKEFWLFGGYGFGNKELGYLNDLWRFRINDSTWTWISGNNIANQSGIYGTVGNASPENIPGARFGAVGGYDSLSQEIWLFGGAGYDQHKSTGILNDLWRYRVKDSTWTWISGSNNSTQLGLYGEKGVASTQNAPGSRLGAVGWYDRFRKEFWVFGGHGYSANVTRAPGYLNDLWRFRVDDSTWTWMSGNITVDDQGVYGEKGNASSNSVPSARGYSVGWHDSITHEFWVLGGFFSNDEINDFWKASLPKSCPPHYQRIRNSCIPLFDCTSDGKTASKICFLRCKLPVLTNTCVIDGDIILNGSNTETKSVTIVGVINVTGSVIATDEVEVTLSPGAALHVGKCLVLENGSHMVAVVDSDTHSTVLASYDASCSSPQMTELVSIESSVHECSVGRPKVDLTEDIGGRARLELLFVSISDSSECAGRKLNIVALCVIVPLAVLAVIAVVVILAVPKLKEKVLPGGVYCKYCQERKK